MSIYSGDCGIYTARHSVHLRYHYVPEYPESLLEDVLGGWDRASFEMHLETEKSSQLRDALRGHD